MSSLASSGALPRRKLLARPTAWPRSRLPLVVASALAIGVLLTAQAADSRLAVYWVLGLAVGMVLQRGRVCFAGAFRDLHLMRNGSMLRAVLVGLAIATPAFALIEAQAVPNPAFGALPQGAHVVPVGLHLVVGGLLFGVGMVVAGGCVSGTLYRIGEGYLASWSSLAGILVGLVVASHTWNAWWTWHIQGMPADLAACHAGLRRGGARDPAGVGGGVRRGAVVGNSRRQRSAVSDSAGQADTPGHNVWRAPDGAARDRTRQRLAGGGGGQRAGRAERARVPDRPPAGCHGRAARRGPIEARASSGSLPRPSSAPTCWPGCNLVLEQLGLVSEHTMLDGGLVVGALLGATAAGEFKLRAPRQRRRYVQSVAGGGLMGYGAGIAIGCTLGAFFSAIPSLGLSGWIFGIALLAGAGLGTRIIRRIA